MDMINFQNENQSDSMHVQFDVKKYFSRAVCIHNKALNSNT